ncbi:unnamed protein product [Haemonchus placei]|uniref:Uncharacterized protein n=1 Tax=Haemonchus placei TaxID=6290 RepID=A0A0N4X5C9_HAEPC|nr:unnamed protein product [Haemonchus placei]
MDSTYRGPRVGVSWRARGFLLGQPFFGVPRWLNSSDVRGGCALEAIALGRCTSRGLEVQPAPWKMAFVLMPFAGISPCIGRFSQEQQVLWERESISPSANEGTGYDTFHLHSSCILCGTSNTVLARRCSTDVSDRRCDASKDGHFGNRGGYRLLGAYSWHFRYLAMANGG